MKKGGGHQFSVGKSTTFTTLSVDVVMLLNIKSKSKHLRSIQKAQAQADEPPDGKV